MSFIHLQNQDSNEWRYYMAKVKCAICGKKTESSYNGVKHCPKCGLWFCYDHAGTGRTQCPKCKSYSLK